MNLTFPIIYEIHLSIFLSLPTSYLVHYHESKFLWVTHQILFWVTCHKNFDSNPSILPSPSSLLSPHFSICHSHCHFHIFTLFHVFVTFVIILSNVLLSCPSSLQVVGLISLLVVLILCAMLFFMSWFDVIDKNDVRA